MPTFLNKKKYIFFKITGTKVSNANTVFYLTSTSFSNKCPSFYKNYLKYRGVEGGGGGGGGVVGIDRLMESIEMGSWHVILGFYGKIWI